MYASEPSQWLIFTQVLMGGFCWLSFAAVISWGIGHMFFSPLNERTLLFRADNRFRISDLLLLAVHLQIAIGFVLALSGDTMVGMKAALCVTLGALVCFWWYNGIRMLSRSGVTYTWHRWIFLGIIMPLGYLSTLFIVGSFISVPLSLGLFIQAVTDRDLANGAIAVLVLGVSLGAIAMVYASRTFCRKMAERARQEQAHRDGIAFEAQESGISFLPHSGG